MDHDATFHPFKSGPLLFPIFLFSDRLHGKGNNHASGSCQQFDHLPDNHFAFSYSNDDFNPNSNRIRVTGAVEFSIRQAVSFPISASSQFLQHFFHQPNCWLSGRSRHAASIFSNACKCKKRTFCNYQCLLWRRPCLFNWYRWCTIFQSSSLHVSVSFRIFGKCTIGNCSWTMYFDF